MFTAKEITAHKASSHQQQHFAASGHRDMVLIMLSSGKKCSKICQAEELNTTSFLFSLSSHCLLSISNLNCGGISDYVFAFSFNLLPTVLHPGFWRGLGFGFFFGDHVYEFLCTAVVTRHSELTVRERTSACCHCSFVVQFSLWWNIWWSCHTTEQLWSCLKKFHSLSFLFLSSLWSSTSLVY